MRNHENITWAIHAETGKVLCEIKYEAQTMYLPIELVEQFGYTQTGKQLGVSGNSVKKHIKNNITYKDSLDPQS